MTSNRDTTGHRAPRLAGLFVVCLTAGVLSLTVGLRTANACKTTGVSPFRTTGDPPPGDAPPPAKPNLEVERIKRGTGPERAGLFGQSVTSCDDLGWLQLKADPNPSATGYVFELVKGEPPGDVTFSDKPVAPDSSTGEFTFSWTDGDTDDQEAIDFTVKATPVDQWGRHGPASENLRVSHPGSGGGCGGCSTDGRNAPGSGLALLVVAAGVFLRKRRTEN